MKIGDMVKWKGFPGDPVDWLWVGIITAISWDGYTDVDENQCRVCVMWHDGTFGDRLFPTTTEVIYEEANLVPKEKKK